MLKTVQYTSASLDKWQAWCREATRQYDASRRAFRRNREHAKKVARLAHPATGGEFGIIHNWGNAEAKAAWAAHDREWQLRSAIFDAAYRAGWEAAKS